MRSRLHRAALAVLVGVGLVAVHEAYAEAPSGRYGCLDTSRAATAARRAEYDRLRRDPSLTLAHWRPMRDKPVEERVQPATPALAKLESVPCAEEGERRTNPRPAVDNDPFLREVSRAAARLPEPVRQWMRRYVYGIVVAEDLGISGRTRVLEDERERPVAVLITLNASVLRGTASTWATWKEGTPFEREEGWRLRVRMDEGDDGHEALLQYVLIHELGHALALISGLQTLDGQAPSRRQYFDLSWTEEGSRFDPAFPQRAKVRYYDRPLLAAADMERVYEALSATNLPTLYAATNSGEDFADAFANFVHTQVLKRPYEVLVETPAGVKRFGPCWDEPRCQAKRQMFEWFLLPR